MVACALTGSCLDYANSVLYGTNQKNISKLQKAQNLQYESSTVPFSPVNIIFSNDPIAAHQNSKHHFPQSPLLSTCLSTLGFECLSFHLFSRSSSTNLLSVPFVGTSFGARSFSVTAPAIWYCLPRALRMRTSPDTFRRHLKIHISSRPSDPLSTFPLAHRLGFS